MMAGAGATELTSTQGPRSSTVRVGMWTLWRDREIVLKPSAGTMLQTCDACGGRRLRESATIRADDQLSIDLVNANRTEHLKRIRLWGGVTVTAHSESVPLLDPVTITVRNGALVLAVSLPLERYVERVVASESGPADNPESLKALAIVVRSYALHETHGHPDYDLCDSTHCQLLHWHETPQRSPAAHAATLATAGETLWYRGGRALAYFSKDCGGRSASLAEVWPRVRAAPYLESHGDSYCTRESSGWSSELTRADLTAALAARGLAAPGWQHLAVERRGASGRAAMIRVDKKQVPAEDFRIAVGESLGWNRLPSTWFEVSQQGDRFVFHGRGTGHGMGLCQKGAAMMAAQGRSFREILDQYFPGTQTTDESTGKAWQSFTRAGLVLETLNAEDARFLSEMERARAEASTRSGLHYGSSLTVRAYVSTPAFRDATLAAGWTAAFAEGNWIATQPLATLAARGLLLPTLIHEFIHALVEHEASPQAPLWLREGLAELWSADPDGQARLLHGAPSMTMDSIDAALRHPATESQACAAHRDAAILAGRLLDRYGRGQVLDWLRSGVPAGAGVGIGQR